MKAGVLSSCVTPSLDPCLQTGWRSQFGCPRGWLGWAVGHLMAWKNRRRGQWVLGRLALEPGDRVLEIGFGSGADIRRALAAVPSGSVAGVDHSAEMVRQARKRNAAAVREGRADLRLGSASQLPFADAAFDRVFSINAAQFWPDPRAVLAECRRVMRPGARIAIAVQPRNANATLQDSERTGEFLRRSLEQAGFQDVALEYLDTRSVPVALAMGVN